MVDRRTVLTAGLASLAAATGAAVTGCSSGTTNAGGGGRGGTNVSTSDVPVGGGVLAGAYIVTQPTAGTFKAYSGVCPHAGCAVSQMRGAQAVCPCHGSVFSLADGSRVSGPTPSGLSAAKATVSGSTVTVTSA